MMGTINRAPTILLNIISSLNSYLITHYYSALRLWVEFPRRFDMPAPSIHPHLCQDSQES
jgi:hypothetical protein